MATHKESNTDLASKVRMYCNRLIEFYPEQELNEFLLSLGDFRRFVEEYLIDNRIKVDFGVLDSYFCLKAHTLFADVYRKNVEAIQHGFYTHIPLPQLALEYMQAETKKLAQEMAYMYAAGKKKIR